MAVEPSQPGTIMAGTDVGLFVSHDSGATWNLALPDVRVWTVGFDARSSGDAFAGTDGKGVYASLDAGATWTPASTGLQNLDVRSLAFGLDGIAAGTNAGVALSPNGLLWHDGGLDAYSIASVAVAANYPQFTVIAGADSGNVSQGYLFSSSGGGAWEVLQSGLPSGAVVSSITAGQIDQAVPKRPLIVATSQGSFRSGDGGSTWTEGTGVSHRDDDHGRDIRAARSHAGVRRRRRRRQHGRRFLPFDRRRPHVPQSRHRPPGRQQEHRRDRGCQHDAARGGGGRESADRWQPCLHGDRHRRADPAELDTRNRPGRRCRRRSQRRFRRRPRSPLHQSRVRPRLHRAGSSASPRPRSTGRRRWCTRSSSSCSRSTCTSAGGSATTSKGLPDTRRPNLAA